MSSSSPFTSSHYWYKIPETMKVPTCYIVGVIDGQKLWQLKHCSNNVFWSFYTQSLSNHNHNCFHASLMHDKEEIGNFLNVWKQCSWLTDVWMCACALNFIVAMFFDWFSTDFSQNFECCSIIALKKVQWIVKNNLPPTCFHTFLKRLQWYINGKSTLPGLIINHDSYNS